MSVKEGDLVQTTRNYQGTIWKVVKRCPGPKPFVVDLVFFGTIDSGYDRENPNYSVLDYEVEPANPLLTIALAANELQDRTDR